MRCPKIRVPLKDLYAEYFYFFYVSENYLHDVLLMVSSIQVAHSAASLVGHLVFDPVLIAGGRGGGQKSLLDPKKGS